MIITITETETQSTQMFSSSLGKMDVMTETWSGKWKIEIKAPLIPPLNKSSGEKGRQGNPAACKTLYKYTWVGSFETPNFIFFV